MLQADCALSAAARTRRAAAPRVRERDALGRCLRGPPSIPQEGCPPLEGAGVVVHEKTVTQWRPHAGRRPQAPDPRVPAVCRKAHKLQQLLAACREKLALDYKAFAGRALPASLVHRLWGTRLPLGEQAQILRKAAGLVECHLVAGTLLCEAPLWRCRSLLPLGGRVCAGPAIQASALARLTKS